MPLSLSPPESRLGQPRRLNSHGPNAARPWLRPRRQPHGGACYKQRLEVWSAQARAGEAGGGRGAVHAVKGAVGSVAHAAAAEELLLMWCLRWMRWEATEKRSEARAPAAIIAIGYVPRRSIGSRLRPRTTRQAPVYAMVDGWMDGWMWVRQLEYVYLYSSIDQPTNQPITLTPGSGMVANTFRESGRMQPVLGS